MSLGAPRPAARPPANTVPAPEVSTVATSAPDAPSPATARARRPQRRGTTTGRHWEEAANLFVKEIPPVKCFSDTRPVPMRDVRGWIDTIGQQAHNLVWVALMRSLTQADLDDSGDKEICRYILACVIVEERHPDTEKRQTRQAVNNAIKRELMCPRANGRSARGKTFRELFRDKAVECGFRVAPAEESQQSQHPQPTESTSSQPAVLRPLTPRADTSAPQAGATRAANGHGPNSRSGKTPVKKGDMDLIPVSEHSHRSKRPRSDVYTDEPPEGLEVIARAVEMNGVNSLSGINLDKLQPTADGRIPFWELGPLEVLKVEKALVLKGKLAIVKDLLQDFRWIHRRVMENESGLRNLVRSGYDVLLSCERGLTDPEWEGFRLIRNCLMLIRPVIEPELHAVLVRKRPVRAGLRAQLASQLYGRLLEPSRKFSVISTLLESIRQYAGRPWLRPLNPCLEAPFTDIAMAFHSGPDALPSAVAISHDGELVLTSGEDSKCVDQHSTSYGMQRGSRQMQSYSVRVWRVESGECICSITGHSSSVMHLGITRDKSHVVSSSSALSTDPLKFWKIRDRNGLYIERVTTGIAARTQNTMVFSIALLPDSKHVIAGTGSASGRGAIRMWNITTGAHVAEFDGRIGTPFGLDITPDGSFLVSGDTDGMISLWNISLKKKTFSIENQSSTQGTVASEQEMQQGGHDPLRDPRQQAAVFSVCFVLDRQFAITPRQLLIAAGDQSCIRIWSLKQSMDVDSLPFQSTSSAYDYEPVYELRSGLSNNMGPMCNVTRIQSAGEGTLFSGSGDGSTRMWKLLGEKKYQAVRLGTDLQQSAVPGTRRNSLRGSVFVAASDDGKRVASSTERSLVPVWDIERYERALERNKQLYRSYFVYTPGSVSFTDMLSPSYGMPQSQYYPSIDYRNSDSGLVDEYFLVVDLGSDMQFVTKSGPARNEVTVTLTFQGAASSQDLYLAFDDQVAENVNRNQLRGGTFLRPTIAGEEPFDDAELTQKGVVVRLRDGSLGFFELERHIPSKAETK